MFHRTDSVILKTKISLPIPKQSLVLRNRLADSITAGLEGRLTLVCAPAGFGKTTLLGQWVHSKEQLCAWVSLDDKDNDEVRFWRYVVHAFAEVVSEAARKRIELLAEALPSISIPTFLDSLLNELLVLKEKIVLILDDFHRIQVPQIHEGVSYFIDYLPDSIHVIISTRTELPFSTMKWVAKGESQSITTSQLQFTQNETDQFCKLTDTPLLPHHIEQLVQLTEGWITGLQLVSLSLRYETNYDRFIQEYKGNHHYIAEYLFHEVVAKLPAKLYDFLLKTSVLNRFDAMICDSVLQHEESFSMLEEIKRLNLFLVPLDGQNRWFRYHHLFSQFLQEHLKKSAPELWRESHRLASEAFAERGLMEEAIDHALKAEDFALMARYLEKHIPVVLQRGEFATLLRWFESIPEEFNLTPELSLLHVFVMVITGQTKRSEDQLERIEQQCLAIPDQERMKQLQSGILFVRSNLMFSSGDFTAWFTFSDGMLDEILPENPTYYNFNYNLTEPLIRRTALGLKGALSADMERVGKLFTGVLEKHSWQDSLINLYVKQCLSEGYYEWNRLDECEQLLPILEQAAILKQLPGLLVPTCITRARIYLAKRRFDLAHNQIDETLEIVTKLQEEHWTNILRAFKACIYLDEGKITKAKREISLLGLSSNNKPTFNREFEYLALIRLLEKQGKVGEALRLLELLKPQSTREQLLSSMVEIAILQARLEYQHGKRKAALRSIHEALVISEQNTYIRSFIDEGEEIKALLTLYLSSERMQSSSFDETKSDVTGEYVRKLIGLFPSNLKQDVRHSTAPALAEPLNRSELNLLRQIKLGASNKQIAEALALSEGTVKVYLSRLYEKLHVSSRTQALAVAQELKLLE